MNRTIGYGTLKVSCPKTNRRNSDTNVHFRYINKNHLNNNLKINIILKIF